MTVSANGKAGRSPRSSNIVSQNESCRFLNLSPYEHKWIRTIPDMFPDILRAPAVTYKPSRDDPRIMKNNYVALSRPYKCQQGLLLIGKQQRPILIHEQTPDNPHVIPMRLDRESILDTWIFTVSIYQTEGLIHIEDCIATNGEQIRSTKTFKERYAFIERFVESIWYQDTRFQLNWQICVAETFPLGNIKEAIQKLNGGFLCLMPNVPEYRLLRVIPVVEEAPKPVGGPIDFICVGVERKPDVYDLKDTQGKDYGRASIQTLSISQALQQKRSTGEPIRVMAEWNDDFESYIVTSVL